MKRSLNELNLKIKAIKAQSSNSITGFIGYNSISYIKTMMLFMINDAVVMPLSPSSIDANINKQLKIVGCDTLICDIEKDCNNLSAAKIIPFSFFKEIENIDIYLLNEMISEIMQNCPDKAADILFTSGSTGKLKAVMHNYSNHYLSAKGSNLNIDFNKEDKWMISLPVNHIGGFSIMMRSAVSGASFCVKNKDEGLIEAIMREKATHISLTPSQLSSVLEKEDKKQIKVLKSLKAILVGGSKASLKLVEKSNENNLNIYFSYGLTEMSSQVTCTPQGCNLEKLKTSGKLLKYRELKISSEKEILVKGGVLFKEAYLDNGTLQLDALDDEGWYATGDIGFLDSDGYLNIVGRKDLMFDYKGEKIFPEEIEEELKHIKEVEDAYVVALEDEITGNIPAAFIKSSNYESLNYEKIQSYLRGRIEKHKIPSFIFKLPEKKDDFLKPDRQALKLLAYDFLMNGRFMR